MEAFSALLALCAGNSPFRGEFPLQRPVTRSFDLFFDLRPNKRLSKQSWGWWFEMPSRSFWRHCNGICHDACRYTIVSHPFMKSSFDIPLTTILMEVGRGIARSRCISFLLTISPQVCTIRRYIRPSIFTAFISVKCAALSSAHIVPTTTMPTLSPSVSASASFSHCLACCCHAELWRRSRRDSSVVFT